MNNKERLGEIVRRDAVQHGEFTLASGRKSNIYIDLRKVTLAGEGAALIGELIEEILRDYEVDAVGGMTMGADPIATTASIACHRAGRQVDAFLVRKEQKEHGMQRMVEGPVREGMRVAVVEDVITTGGSTLKAMDHIIDAGLKVACVIAVLDRCEGGRENIEARGVKVHALLDRNDL